MSPTSGRQTLTGLQMAPASLRFRKHLKMDLPVNELKIKSISSYAVLGILFPCIDRNSLTTAIYVVRNHRNGVERGYQNLKRDRRLS